MTDQPIDYASIDDKDTEDVRTFEQVQALIAEKHGAVLDKDDPMAIQFTLQQIFLEDVKAVLGNFRKQMVAILESTGKTTASHVQTCLETLKDETLESSLNQTLARVAQEAKNVSGVHSALARLRNATFIMVILSWVALLLNILVLARS